MSNIAKKLGQRVKLLRELRSLTQEQLAEQVETTSQYVSSLERGLQNVTLSTLEKLANALGVEIFSLFSFDSKDIRITKQSLKKLIDDVDDKKIEVIGQIVRTLIS